MKADGPSPILYTAQDVARFCEVDLKTIHHWADAGKIAHHRTEGRHLRFRHVPLVRFLRSHGYPLHDKLASARPAVCVVAPSDDGASEHAEVVKKLSARFFVRSYGSAISALARLALEQPDAIVCPAADPTWSREAVAALKDDAGTAWPFIVAIVEDATDPWPRVDLQIARADISRLPGELANALGLD